MTDFLRYSGFIIAGFVTFMISIVYLGSISQLGAISGFAISTVMLYAGIRKMEIKN
ncbi:hypothetical protein [Methanohalobium evestigatum]|uniref:hypothetical protein n=1 Tax=Methanohalobium evestigatum TaxID=2322 RepID=UPI0012F652AD|nr:hypothetical protein [Methanohalobium evestigatum]